MPVGRPKGSVRWPLGKSPTSNPCANTRLKSTKNGEIRVVIRKVGHDIDYRVEGEERVRTVGDIGWRKWCLQHKPEVLDNPWEREL